MCKNKEEKVLKKYAVPQGDIENVPNVDILTGSGEKDDATIADLWAGI